MNLIRHLMPTALDSFPYLVLQTVPGQCQIANKHKNSNGQKINQQQLS